MCLFVFFVLLPVNVLLLLIVAILSTKLRKAVEYSETKELVGASYLAVALSLAFFAVRSKSLSPQLYFLATCLERHLVFTSLVFFLFLPKLRRLVLHEEESVSVRPSLYLTSEPYLERQDGRYEVDLISLHERSLVRSPSSFDSGSGPSPRQSFTSFLFPTV